MINLAEDQKIWVPWMRRSIQLALLAEGRTSPNPLVGSVVLDSNGRLVGEGFHTGAGNPHAEIEALAALPDFETAEAPLRLRSMEREKDIADGNLSMARGLFTSPAFFGTIMSWLLTTGAPGAGRT